MKSNSLLWFFYHVGEVLKNMKLYSFLNVSGKHILCLYILSERTGQITRESAIYIINGSFPYIFALNHAICIPVILRESKNVFTN
jgi:hypothetical protein